MALEKNIPSDILQPLPLDKWLLLRNTLKRDWPRFAYHYYWINNAIKWKAKEPNIELNIYCPEGKYDQGVFVGVSSYSLHMVILFTFEESKYLFFDCLTKTNQIDWSRTVVLGAVHGSFYNTVIDAIAYLEKEIGLKIEHDVPGTYNYKSKEECLKAEIKVPDGFELSLLQDSDITLVHDQWPHVEAKTDPEKSTKFLATQRRLNKGVGLYTKSDNRLVSWAIESEWGGLANVQTINEFKGRGYARVVVNALSKMLAEEGNDTILFIVQGNKSSEHMFSSLNWKPINSMTYIILNPKSE